MSDLHSINHDQKLYVLREGHGYSCLGFEVCERWAKGLAEELGVARAGFLLGTVNHYEEYCALVAQASKRNLETGWRAESQLTPQLKGLEGKRVEVIDMYDQKRRFWVGKSMGFIPCHLEIHNTRSHGGMSASSQYKSVKVVRERR